MKQEMKITKFDILKMERTARRTALIEANLYTGFRKSKPHKSKKQYTRKNKRKFDLLSD